MTAMFHGFAGVFFLPHSQRSFLFAFFVIEWRLGRIFYGFFFFWAVMMIILLFPFWAFRFPECAGAVVCVARDFFRSSYFLTL